MDRKEETANHLLQCIQFECFWNDSEEPEECTLVDEAVSQSASKLLFPIILKKITTGSRAERVFLEDSDTDYIYEIGPGKVFDRLDKCSAGFLFYRETQNEGYYQILDADEGIIYPKLLQLRLAPILCVGNEWNNDKKYSIEGLCKEQSTKASIEDKQKNDQVLALSLDKWPNNVLEYFLLNKLKWNQKLLGRIKDMSLYFIPKSHPFSSKKEVEWRLSFSLVEKEIMLSIPKLHRRAYVLCKWLKNKMFGDDVDRYGFHSFFLKTVFLGTLDACSVERNGIWYTKFFQEDLKGEPNVTGIPVCNPREVDDGSTRIKESIQIEDKYVLEVDDEKHLVSIVKNIYTCVSKSLEDGILVNYFVPGINLLESTTTQQRKNAKQMIDSLLSSLASRIHDFVNDHGVERISWNSSRKSVEFEMEVLRKKYADDLMLISKEGGEDYIRMYFIMQTFQKLYIAVEMAVERISKTIDDETYCKEVSEFFDRQIQEKYQILRLQLQERVEGYTEMPRKCFSYAQWILQLFTDYPVLAIGLKKTIIFIGESELRTRFNKFFEDGGDVLRLIESELEKLKMHSNLLENIIAMKTNEFRMFQLKTPFEVISEVLYRSSEKLLVFEQNYKN